MLTPYQGPRPAAAGREGKYSVIYGDDGEMQVRAIYPIDNREKALLTTEEHPELVDMVNRVKENVNKVPGGVFYINEYRQVLVPAGSDYYCAGTYDRVLTFDLDGTTISPEAPDNLQPGDPWPGPRVGMTYTLAAGGENIYCEYQPAPRRVRKIYLSDDVGEKSALFLAERIAEIKGKHGGRIRINEAQEFFGPVERQDVPLYLGALDGDPWFKRFECP